MNKQDRIFTTIIAVFGLVVGVVVDTFIRGQFVLGGEWLVWIFPMAMYWLTKEDDERRNQNV